MGDVLKALGDVIRETAAQNHPDERKRGRIMAWIEQHGGAVRKSLVRVQKGRVKGHFRRNVNGLGRHWVRAHERGWTKAPNELVDRDPYITPGPEGAPPGRWQMETDPRQSGRLVGYYWQPTEETERGMGSGSGSKVAHLSDLQVVARYHETLNSTWDRYADAESKARRKAEAKELEAELKHRGMDPKQARDRWRKMGTRSPWFRAWFRGSQVVNEDGTPKVVYRGDNMGHKLDDRYKLDKVYSGRFYFTEDPDVASNYATNKRDVRAHDNFDGYGSYFLVNVPGSRKRQPLDRLWYSLDSNQKQRVRDVMLASGWTDEGELDFSGEHQLVGKDHWEHEAQRAHGNWLTAAHETWLGGGYFIREEWRFLRILKEAGITDVEYDSPFLETPATTPVYLRILTPLDTDNISPAVVERLRAVAKADRARGSKNGVDHWDKTTTTAKDFMRALDEDLATGRTDAWTSMPESITDALMEMGFDGVKDTGGKNGGVAHRVWIAFNPDQIKSALGNEGQFNSEDDSIVKALAGERVLAPNGGTVVFRDIEPVEKSVIRVRKAAFASPFPFGKPAGRMTVAEAVAAIRQAIATEHEAVAQYQALAESAADKDVREAFTGIADEERVHIGELEALLLKLAPSEKKLRAEGGREVTAEIAKALEACL